jgi:predicted transcriptional regulator of viral defense system
MSTKNNILAQLNRNGKEIYTFSEIQGIASNLSQGTIWKVLSELVKEKRLIRLKRGIYLYVPEGYQENWTTSNFWIGANLVQPYAISFWSALNQWGLTEQLPNRTYIQTTKSIVNYSKNILGSEYQFVRLSPKRFFGNMKIWVANHQVNITDQEKTLVDCLAFPAYCGGISEAVKGLYNFYQYRGDLTTIWL